VQAKIFNLNAFANREDRRTESGNAAMDSDVNHFLRGDGVFRRSLRGARRIRLFALKKEIVWFFGSSMMMAQL
jgi:hypothetical protein